MTTLTLLTKTKDNKQLKQVHQALQTHFSGLDIEARILGTVGGGWIQLSLSGEDEAIATNYIVQEIGLCPSSFAKVKFSTVKGYINNIKSDGSGLYVDVGIFKPEIVLAFIPLNSLQIGLVNGMDISLGKLADLFGFCEGVPIRVTVNSLNENETFLDARL